MNNDIRSGSWRSKWQHQPHAPILYTLMIPEPSSKNGSRNKDFLKCYAVTEQSTFARSKDDLWGALKSLRKHMSQVGFPSSWLWQSQRCVSVTCFSSQGGHGLESWPCTFVTACWFPKALTYIIWFSAHINTCEVGIIIPSSHSP